MTIAREDKGLLRMTLDASARPIERVETINDELQECRGLLYAYDALYANANNSKGLYRLRDTDGDDQFDEVRLLREFPGSVGHGRNDLALGPDGLIYSIHGDSVDVPKDNIVDYTSPFREARRGKNTREGHLHPHRSRRPEMGAARRRPAQSVRHRLQSARRSVHLRCRRRVRHGLALVSADASRSARKRRRFRLARRHRQVAALFSRPRGQRLPTLDIGKGSPTAVAFGTAHAFPPRIKRRCSFSIGPTGAFWRCIWPRAAPATAPGRRHF